MITNYSDEILENVTMKMVLEKYHVPGNKNRTTCPFHNGKHNNFSYNHAVYNCFSCGAKGNVITFVKEMFGLDFLPAVSKINDDFNLGLVLNRKMTIREREKMRENTENRRLLHVEKERRRTAYMDRKNALLDEWSRLDNNRRDFAPQSMDDDFHPLYAEAVRKIDAVELSLLEMMEETV